LRNVVARGLKPGTVVWLLNGTGHLEYKNGVICSGIVKQLLGRGRSRQALVAFVGDKGGSTEEWWSVAMLCKSAQQQFNAEMERIAAKGMRL